MSPKEFAALDRYLTPEERAELDDLIAADLAEVPWRPFPGPQTMAYESTADVIGFGGSAGGGKTDLACGMAITQQHHSQMFRREGPQLKGILDRIKELVDPNLVTGNPPVYRERATGRQIEFTSLPNLGDEKKYQGRPKDFLVIDEASNFLEAQVRFIKGWVRTTRPGQRKRVLLTFNPPTDADGRWIIDFFGPWLDKRHALYPSVPGQLRWVYMNPGTNKDVWIENGDNSQFVLVDGERFYDFDPEDYTPEEIITPESRTFIPSRVTDNPALVGTGYMTQLQALPEPLRSQMLFGDFNAGTQDSPMQVVPTAWVEAAMARWREPTRRGEMLSLGTDVARGGADNTVLAPRHRHDGTDYWFDKLDLHKGEDTPNGQKVAGLMIAKQRDSATLVIDVIGVGSSPYDILTLTNQDVIGVNASEKALGTDKSGRLTFYNQRSEDWWRMRELLDPSNNHGVCLPPDPELLKELCAPQWAISGFVIKVESRQDIIDRVGRSPDRATAVVLAARDVVKRATFMATNPNRVREHVVNHNPVEAMQQHDRADEVARQHVLNYDPTRY